MRLFFEKIFIVPKGSPLRVFSYFATECMLIHHKGSPLLHFSALCDFFLKEFFFKNSCFFPKKIFLRFLSLRYGADFGRSRLVYIKIFTVFVCKQLVQLIILDWSFFVEFSLRLLSHIPPFKGKLHR